MGWIVAPDEDIWSPKPQNLRMWPMWKAFTEVIAEVKRPWLALNQCDWCPYNKGKIGHGDRHAQKKTVWTETHRSRGWSDTAKRLRWPANRQKPGVRQRTDSPHNPPKGRTLRTPWFWTSGLSNCETINFCYFKPQFSVLCFGNPRKLIQLMFKKIKTCKQYYITKPF